MKDQCSICGSTEELMTIIQLDRKKVVFDFGIKPLINASTIVATTRYCNICFLQRVWNKDALQGH